MKFKLNENRKEIITDTLTPVSIYLKIRDNYANSILLESSDYSSKDNSYAYICFKPIAKFQVENNHIKTKYPGKEFITEKINDDELKSKNIYSCLQTLFKLHPDFDEVLLGILKKDQKAKIFFIVNRQSC